jgi:hypothetical protein
MKGQPLTYNKDNQEDKEPLFDTVDTLRDHAAHHGRDGGRHRRQARGDGARRAKGYATATDLADYLVKKGLPFRDAHEVVAHAVKVGIARGVDLADLPLDTLKTFHAAIDDDVYACSRCAARSMRARSRAARRRRACASRSLRTSRVWAERAVVYEVQARGPVAGAHFRAPLRAAPGLRAGPAWLSRSASGCVGYAEFEHLPWLDAFLNAAMLLGGDGPGRCAAHSRRKLFAGCYALYAGLVFLVTGGAALHARCCTAWLHRFHWDDEL